MLRTTLLAFAVLASIPASAQTSNESFAASIVEFPAVTRSKGTLKTTGAAIAPGLTAAGVHSCAGSTTAAAGFTGGALSFGSTYAMQGCERRANAASLMGLGLNTPALALLCNDPEVMAALNQSGVRCPQQAVQQVATAPAPRAAARAVRSATPWRD